LPQSGTIPRALATSLGLPGALGTAEYLRTGDPKDAIVAAGAGFAGPKLVQAALNNPAIANYVANGLQNGSIPIRSLLLAPSENAVIGQARRIPVSMMLQQQGQQK
jgi:hypothetical protein